MKGNYEMAIDDLDRAEKRIAELEEQVTAHVLANEKLGAERDEARGLAQGFRNLLMPSDLMPLDVRLKIEEFDAISKDWDQWPPRMTHDHRI